MIVLVTGANRGLGLQTAGALEELGHEVIRTARTPSAARGELQLDVRPPVTLPDGLPERIDVVVNNAGVALQGFDADVCRRTIDVNVRGAMTVTGLLLPRLNDQGTIVMVSSGLGSLSCLAPRLQARFADPDLTQQGVLDLCDEFIEAVAAGRHRDEGWPSSAYNVSKVALNALTRVLATSPAYVRHGHRINAVCPGWVRTDMGGRHADRSVEEGAAGIVWAATLPRTPESPTGGFYRDGIEQPW